MADNVIRLSKSAFLSRTKRFRSGKEPDVRNVEPFKLDNDVVDFLRPSTDRAALQPKGTAPKLDQDSSLERQVHAKQDEVPTRRSSRRRDGLRVAFAKTPPEIMGEGGDECPHATIEISRMKSVAGRRLNVEPSDAYDQPTLDGVRSVPQQKWSTKAMVESSLQMTAPNSLYSTSPLPSSSIPSPTVIAPQQHNDTVDRISSRSSKHADRLRVMAASEAMSLRRASILQGSSHTYETATTDENDAPNHLGKAEQFALPAKELDHSRTQPSINSTTNAPAFSASHTELVQQWNSPSENPRCIKRHEDHHHQASNDSKVHHNAIPSSRPSVARNDFSSTTSSQQQYPGQAVYNAHSEDDRTNVADPDNAHVRGTDARSKATARKPVNRATSRHTNQEVSTSKTSDNGQRVHRYSRNEQHRSKDGLIDAKLADFAERVTHLQGVFQLTAEKELPEGSASPVNWLRTACWWYIHGKLGLGAAVKHRQHTGQFPGSELLLQGHVDIAKTWWILDVPLRDQLSSTSQCHDDGVVHNGCTLLLGHLQSLCSSMHQNQMMPPAASLIQRQDTRIWNDQAQSSSKSAKQIRLALDQVSRAGHKHANPLLILPLSDTPVMFCYTRFPVIANAISLSSDFPATALSCILSVTRSRDEYQNTIVIVSQDELVNLTIGPQKHDCLRWTSVSWQTHASSLLISPKPEVTLEVKMNERDFASLRRMFEYTQRVQKMISPAQGERLAQQFELASLQYDEAAQSALIFPEGEVEHCRLLLFSLDSAAAYSRVVFVTESQVKTVSCVSHDLDAEAITFLTAIGRKQLEGTEITISLPSRRGAFTAKMVFCSEGERRTFQRTAAGLRPPDASLLCKIPSAATAVSRMMTLRRRV